MSDTQLPKLPATDERLFEAGDCLCGVPNCNGHEMIDAKIEIPSHPLASHSVAAVIVHVRMINHFAPADPNQLQQTLHSVAAVIVHVRMIIASGPEDMLVSWG
jgi:hypothetical protein